ncbi:hydroxyisourate hydrolase [Thiomonas bhubaneswarensis]|uniref:5-hydroxyisourate hydrolase n=1 Tax=Thiomonas bhubaneswarensis TaxID=339866 RepID=A0A0K6I493_9BURK|nr:hydroxyisourate hydrolase [Thiomonas bhubaneswarensis]CUA98087.1 hydroxyisourate hydrolase [Thiomonas bhubaneswarensis]
MGALTTHILDTAHGRPAVAVHIDLFAYQGAGWALLRSAQTNADGRCDAPLLQGADFVPGRYRLVFQIGAYFKGLGLALPQPTFLDQIPLEFGVGDAQQHYHVPLLVSPWSYSTYRGS